MPTTRDPYNPGPSQPSLFPDANQPNATNEPMHPTRFHLRCDIEIYIKSLTQTQVYGGMLEGYPNQRVNEGIVNKAIGDLQKRYDAHVHYIEPPMTPRPEKSNFGDEPWLELPAVQCIAQFGSRSVGEFGSRLALLWFQPHFAMPIDTYVLSKIHALDWARLAEAIDDF